MKNKYLEFREKPYNTGKWVANIDVTNMSKREIDILQAEFVKTTFSEDKYASCLTTAKDSKRVWIDAPPKLTWSEVMQSWNECSSASEHLTVKEFAEFLDGNFEFPKRK